MDALSLQALAEEQLDAARGAHAGRAAHTIYGGHENKLRQTVIALAEGNRLDDHESNGESTLLVLTGRVRIATSADGSDGVECAANDYVVLPLERHNLAALEDSVVLMTVVVGV
ncbi:MAG: cupin [Actinomycetota bacterium]|nr:cupin [Actinomycetota bacterium]